MLGLVGLSSAIFDDVEFYPPLDVLKRVVVEGGLADLIVVGIHFFAAPD